ncbi:MAG: hypothetical protein RRC07_02740 [Anaerolineae bacterium]|nr:hypothetical protein [Anaerolineae bacterium]
MMGKGTRKASFWQPILAPLATGFELVTAHWWLLLLPVAVDIFLWLGPRLSVAPLWRQLVTAVPAGTVPPESLAQLAEAATATNLFALFSFPYFGVPVLTSGIVAPAATPIATTTVPLDGGTTTVGMALLLGLGGILLGAVYHTLLVRALLGSDAGALRRLPQLVMRLIGLVMFVSLVLLLMYLPLSLVAVFLGLLSPMISVIVLTIGIAFMMWYLLFLGFSVHGIVLGGLPVLAAVRASVRLVQQHMVTALWLLLFVFASRALLTILWHAVDAGNWLTLVSIAGHAFIATSLVAGTYVYFAETVHFGDPEAVPGGQ